jgi:two-component system, OmpR family, response regulator ChvI
MEAREAADPRPGASTHISVGPMNIDPEGFAVTIDGRDVSLTLAEFLLLQELASHPFQVLDRVRLSAALREHSLAQPAASGRAVDTHISRLRAKLRDAGYDCIRTMRFVGYRFVPEP